MPSACRPIRLAYLGGAADTDDADARAMQAATFEATWGPYLRQHAQPAFPVKQTPKVYRHLIDHVRGSGPLPALRLGRQPYGVLPIQPTGWRPNGEGAFVAWLGQYLPRIRQLWLTGFPDAPTGLAMYSHEAVSSCVRIRTSNAVFNGPLGIFDDAGNSVDLASRERQLAAELGLGNALPYALNNLYRKDPARLWLPMSADGDLEINSLTHNRNRPPACSACCCETPRYKSPRRQPMSGVREWTRRLIGV